MAKNSLSIADRDRFLAYLEREANACEVAAAKLQAKTDRHDHKLACLRGDAAAFRRVAGLLQEAEVFEG